MSLPDQNPSMMNTLRKTQLVNTSLQSSLQEIFHLERKHVIQLHARFVQNTDTDKTANQCIAFEETFWVFFFHCQELTTSHHRLSERGGLDKLSTWGIPSSTTNLGEGEHNAPHLALIPQAIFTDDFQLGVPVDGKLVDVHRHWQRQARAQVAGMTYNRAASKAVAIISQESERFH